ncbi:hypothetical protein [Paenibacillus gansuensis]|uniref:Uncharacterized protein n=1 Tax=Paenibacillus gansuensis TaxID=306542 RepID=A0ABW5PDY6_9BACL
MLPIAFSIGQANVRQVGIYFNNCLYSCQIAVKEQWFQVDDEWPITVYFDPKSTRFILLLVEGRGIVPAYLLDTFDDLDPDKLDAYYKIFNKLKFRVRRRTRRQRKRVGKHV